MTYPTHARHPLAQKSTSARFNPKVDNLPSLPVIDWSLIGQTAPILVDAPADSLPAADVIILVWTSSEWAALQQVFCQSDTEMPYTEAFSSSWPGWQKYDKNMPPFHGRDAQDWTYWGEYRLVEMQGRKVLLFKSNTHLSWQGAEILQAMVSEFISQVQPALFLSTGTAGGARPQDHVGTVSAVNTGTYYEQGQPQSDWPVYGNQWRANWSTLELADFTRLLFKIPTTESDLTSICEQYNQFHHTDYTLADLNPNNVDMGDEVPQIYDFTGQGTSLLTASSFVVGTSAGTYADFSCIEMDDALIGQICAKQNVPFGFVRNISDPVQGANIPSTDQAGWGSAIYSVYGFYTSFNGALAAWAIVNAQLAALNQSDDC